MSLCVCLFMHTITKCLKLHTFTGIFCGQHVKVDHGQTRIGNDNIFLKSDFICAIEWFVFKYVFQCEYYWLMKYLSNIDICATLHTYRVPILRQTTPNWNWVMWGINQPVQNQIDAIVLTLSTVQMVMKHAASPKNRTCLILNGMMNLKSINNG